MSRRILLNCDNFVGPWVAAKTGGTWQPGLSATIGLCESGQIVAGVVYDNYNRTAVNAHIASVSGGRWLTRQFLWTIFDYPFNQLRVKRITGLVGSKNLTAQSFDEHLGFTLEATLKDAHPDGDLLVYRMFRQDCRWLKLNRSLHHGHWQERSTAGT